MNEKFEIPGLIAKENQTIGHDRAMYQEEMAKLKFAASTSKAMVADASLNGYVVGTDWQWQQPDPFSYPYTAQPYKPIPLNPFTSTQKADTSSLEREMREFLAQKLRPNKTALEELVDGMFDTSEKEQFLMDLGYEFYNNARGRKEFKRGDTSWDGELDLDKVFTKEIRIKFKNLLLTKQVLKFKL